MNCSIFLLTFLIAVNLNAGSIRFETTGYCPCKKCCGKWSNIYPRKTASGHIIKKGDKFIAADKRFAFGTVMFIPGYGTAKVLDRGGSIKGNKLDLYFDSHKDALKWGKKYKNVYIQKGK